MAFPRNSLRAFLQYAKTNLREALKGERKVNIVIGNESADLDSLSSSLLYAYFRSSAPPTGAFSPIYIPLLNIHKSGLRLRPEFSTACQHAGIPTANLLCLDDIQAGFSVPDKTQWILVDHNKLQGSLGSQYSQHVRGVIDHHDEENAIPLATSPEPRIIEKAGSCTSLVIRHFQFSWNAISDMSISSAAGHGQGDFAINDSAYTQRWDAQLAKLALASVLIDTANLTAPGKVENSDREAVKFLEAKIHLSASDARLWNRDEFYDEIDTAERNIDQLSLEEILIKDYKQWTENGKRLGISSVVKPLAFLIQKTSSEASHSMDQILDEFMTERDISVFAIMTAFKSENRTFQRELLLQAREPTNTIIADHFVKTATAELGLAELNVDLTKQTEPSPGSPWREFWVQKDLAKSRKQVAPMLRDALRI